MEVKLRSKMFHWPEIPHRHEKKCIKNLRLVGAIWARAANPVGALAAANPVGVLVVEAPVAADPPVNWRISTEVRSIPSCEAPLTPDWPEVEDEAWAARAPKVVLPVPEAPETEISEIQKNEPSVCRFKSQS